MLAPKCSTFNGRPTFANPMYHKKAQSGPATRLIPDSEEILTLADESRSKLNKDLVKPFDYTKLNNLKYVETLEEELDELESDKGRDFPTSIDMLLQECVLKMIAHKTMLSRHSLWSNQMKDKVVQYTSHAKLKKTGVEEHPRISSISNKTKSVTACNDSLNSRNSNAKLVIQLHQLQSVLWLKHLQLKHGYGIEGFLISTSTTKLLLKKDIVDWLLKLKYVQRSSSSSCEVSKGKKKLIQVKDCFQVKKLILETSVANDTSGIVPQLQKASDYDNPDPAPELQNVSPSADTTVPSQQELDLLFGPLYDEFFNDGTSRVNKSSSPTDNSIQKDTLPSTHIQPTSEPTTLTNVYAEENNNNQAEFTNPLCTSVQENVESSSCNIGTSNMHTFNQPQDSEYRWTKDHPLTQVRGNPSKPVQTR
ncbi:hypothetical protein Tco_1524658 [Tanacetum coccineum]